MIRTMLTATATMALLAAGPAAAFQKLPDGTTQQERENTARLNAEQQAKAKADNDAYNAQVNAAAQQQAAAQATFTEETAAYEAEKARVAALSAEERIKWEADVAACKAGDKTRCAPPAAPAVPKE